MKKILLAGILILLLLVGTAAAVSVSYAQSQEISLSTARDNANCTYFIRSPGETWILSCNVERGNTLTVSDYYL